MNKVIILVSAIFIAFLSYSCKENVTEPDPCDNDTSHVNVKKPNIYLYPQKEKELKVTLHFPLGGKVIESIPKYNEWWNVTVNPTGLINEKYNYLYYECNVPDLYQKEEGWLVKKENLEGFFNENMKQHRFSKKEINDFTEYWIPILKESKYYEIYPQYSSTIEKMITIEFSETPNNFFRLFYFIKGRSDKNIDINLADIEVAQRKEFYALEWGVIFN